MGRKSGSHSPNKAEHLRTRKEVALLCTSQQGSTSPNDPICLIRPPVRIARCEDTRIHAFVQSAMRGTKAGGKKTWDSTNKKHNEDGRDVCDGRSMEWNGNGAAHRSSVANNGPAMGRKVVNLKLVRRENCVVVVLSSNRNASIMEWDSWWGNVDHRITGFRRRS